MWHILWFLLGVATAAGGAYPPANDNSGFCVSASAIDVASAGGGAQNTTVLSYTVPVSGLYIVTLSTSCTTTDTVTISLSYTDANNTTAQAVSLMSALIIGANATASTSYIVRANTSTAVLVKYTISAQSSTKASAVIMRVG